MFQKSDKGKMAREELDYDILREALAKMLEAEGRGALTRIHAEAKVSNVGRIVNGEIPAPSIDTWLKLHYRYPDYIPAPVLKGGKEINRVKQTRNVFSNQGNSQVSGVAGGDIHGLGNHLNGDAKRLANLIIDCWPRVKVRAMIEQLEEERDQLLGTIKKKEMMGAA